jgi:hypothetical protein
MAIKLAGLNALPKDQCAWCREKEAVKFGFSLREGQCKIRWCEEHYHRGEVFVWGLLHNFPGIEVLYNEQKHRMGNPVDKESGDRWLELLRYADDGLVWHLLSAVMLLEENDPWWRKNTQDSYIDPFRKQLFNT